MHLSDFDYKLPESLIAHSPSFPRDHSRLLNFNRHTNTVSHHHFYDLPKLLSNNDVLVFNQTKVFPARLYGKKPTGGKVEILLLKKLSPTSWHALCKPGLKLNQSLSFNSVNGVVTKVLSDGSVHLDFDNLNQKTLNHLGSMPLPPYIHSPLSQDLLKRRYQTTYAKQSGSAAAPTAGLHFTKSLLAKLKQQGVQLEFVTLHVGLGTFKSPTQQQLNNKTLHQEEFTLTDETANHLNQAKIEGKRIIAVGTTTTRVLETCANTEGVLTPQSGLTDIFISPGYKFKFIDALITNFHLPQSSLLMLISALTTSPNSRQKFTNFISSPIGKAYLQAIQEKYRFFSFGDAMFIS